MKGGHLLPTDLRGRHLHRIDRYSHAEVGQVQAVLVVGTQVFLPGEVAGVTGGPEAVQVRFDLGEGTVRAISNGKGGDVLGGPHRVAELVYEPGGDRQPEVARSEEI